MSKSIRDLFHDLTNKHFAIMFGCGDKNETVRQCLEIEGLPEKVREGFLEIRDGLEKMNKIAKEANLITDEIHDRIYQVVDPDTGEKK